MSINRQALQEQHNSQMVRVKNSGMLSNYNSGSPLSDDKEEEMTRSALSTFRQKEEEIEKKKSQVRERVQAQLGRVEEETKRLAVIREELEALEDPLRKEVSLVRKRIDLVNRDLKSLGQSCLKKVIKSSSILMSSSTYMSAFGKTIVVTWHGNATNSPTLVFSYRRFE
ncbi:hypothetical protein Leryth_019181 [Lithospermum erythrorhizon]|nr:hypothetical protein Leryth_019181 [Lithospermum erythrorhizon]